MEKRCEWCQAEMTGRKLARARYCTPKCKETARAHRKREAMLERRRARVCASCGGPIPETVSSKAACCSKACSVKYHNVRRQQDRRTAWESTSPMCKRCGQAIPSTRRVGVLYCSFECKHAEMGDRYRERVPHYMRQRNYGITAEQFDQLLEAQGGCCAICGATEPRGKGGWHVDHCHDSGQIRGLLCHHCNVGLGNFKDNLERLRAAARYVEAHASD